MNKHFLVVAGKILVAVNLSLGECFYHIVASYPYP